jgi:hypothetical protein
VLDISGRWEKFLAGNLVASAVILYLQIPHTITAADCFLGLNIGIIHYNAILDFFLYSIDLLEIIPIIGVTSSIILIFRKRKKNE